MGDISKGVAKTLAAR